MASNQFPRQQHIFSRRFKEVVTSLPTVRKKEYRYHALRHADSIRLLILKPGKHSSPIQISLEKARLRDERDYDAVSYTWASEDGDDATSSRIDCEGGFIQVTKNCEAALRRFRRKDASRALWIDAICIDQTNLNERGQQVGIMRMIYTHAVRVLIWLGEASTDIDETTSRPASDVFLDEIAAVAGQLRALPAAASPRDSALYCGLLDEVYETVLTGQFTTSYYGLKSITGRRWWTRIWVVQEAVVAKRAIMFCGAKSALYEDLCCLYDNLDKDSSHQSYFFRYNTSTGGEIPSHMSMNHYARIDVTGIESESRYVLAFATLLESRYLKATDPRDKIFGISGLCQNMQSILPPPDYKMAEVEVYTQVFKLWLAGSGSLNLLYLTGGAEKHPNYPSWVTDWSRPLMMFYAPQTVDWFDAAHKSRAVCAIADDGKTLRAKGKLVDVVSQISLASSSAYVYAGSLTNGIPGWQASCKLWSNWKSEVGESHHRDVLWRTLCWNATSTAGTAPATSESQKHFEMWYDILMLCKEGRMITQEQTETFSKFGRLAMCLPLCITREDRLASVPAIAKVGDHIVVLAGGHIPFVLRPVDGHYILLGHCYVHGIMDGEAFPENAEELEWFSIH